VVVVVVERWWRRRGRRWSLVIKERIPEYRS